MSSDRELLRLYAQERSETAFAELVGRYVDLVYSAALRVLRGDTHLAQDVAQMVFTDLARKAGGLPRDVVLPGWLYRNASFTAAKAVRSESRRRNREQTAIQMKAIDHQAEPTWEQIADHLDDALKQLTEADRDAIVLRFLQRQDLRSVGLALGISDDAAQKRVGRAVEKLRDIFSGTRAGEKLTAATLASVLSTAAVTAAPSGLAASITAGSLASAAIGTGTGLAILKVIPMTKLNCAVAGVIAMATLTTPIVMQQRSLERARRENVALRQQTEELVALAEANQRIAVEEADAQELQALRSEHVELLRLRNEVRQLREQMGLVRAQRPGDAAAFADIQPGPAVEDPNAFKESMRQLGVAASRGDFSALDKLAEHAAAAMKARTNEHQYVLGDVDDAFEVLGSETGEGNETAFQALWRATRNKALDGLAIRALGQAAALGHEQSLAVLLEPEKHLLLRTSTISALKPVAEAGNQRAIDALAAIATDEKAKGLWYLAASGLEKATISGNANAIDAMAIFARSGNVSARKMALLALENAAFKQHSRASEALRTLGYQ